MTFSVAFARVCDDYALSAEARAQAWESAHFGADSRQSPNRVAVEIYLILAATKGPYVPEQRR